MQASVELMSDQVHAIYRAVTGTDFVDAEAEDEAERLEGDAGKESEIGIEEVTRRFADLEALARHVPAVIERVPPFSFAPPMDVLDAGDEFLIELAAPGIERDDVSVERRGDSLLISGVRRGERAANGRAYLWAEIPRGPFHRVVDIPPGIKSEPRVEIARGMIFIHLTK